MWFRSKQREEPYQVLVCRNPGESRVPARSPDTGAAWSSSARVVRCWVKSRTSATPVASCQRFGRALWRDCLRKQEEGGDDVQSAWPLRPGRHTCYNARHRALRPGNGKPIAEKAGSVRIRGLQLDPMKPESLVIADQPCRGEYVPGPCTHRPSSHGSGSCLKSPGATGKAPRVRLMTGAKS